MTWEEGKAYRVVLTVENGTGSAYVDGQLVGSLEEKPPAGFVALPEHVFYPEETLLWRRPPERVSRILVGEYRYGEVNAEVHVTVKNVLLYNRCFNASEVAALQEKIKEETSVTAPEPGEVPRTAASAASDPTNSAHGEAAAAGGVSKEPSGAAGTGSAATDAAGSSAGDASVTRGAPAPGLNNASAALAKEAADTVQREAGGGKDKRDSSVRGRVSVVSLLLGLWVWVSLL
ncbi:trans-sialidase [Trypanosoma conorhini]|uniref:Trans-sialidase n=1 Tax=Trypanosoma conorhini TaxID=83891 RepID=A0A422MRX8_9TRYP|nr:trans-sialidase [Trypanosoma conorhini]RNE95940.1 trans-sialidase [Trypanosoma conorhini]